LVYENGGIDRLASSGSKEAGKMIFMDDVNEDAIRQLKEIEKYSGFVFVVAFWVWLSPISLWWP
jgi:hypothetical protein